jgi:hypothetical protein
VPFTDGAEPDSLSLNISTEPSADDIFEVPQDDEDDGSSTDEEEPSVVDSDEDEESSPEAFLLPS